MGDHPGCVKMISRFCLFVLPGRMLLSAGAAVNRVLSVTRRWMPGKMQAY